MQIERAAEWFELPARRTNLAHMNVVVEVRPDRRAALGGVTHVNGSARLKTVARADNPRLRDLLEAFGELTSVPVLINTSFNRAGEPLVDSLMLGACTGLFSFLPPLAVLLLLCGLIGLVYGRVAPIYNYVAQIKPPPRGRVVGVMTSLSYAAGPAGYLLAGPLIETTGMRRTFFVLAIPMIIDRRGGGATVLAAGAGSLPGDIERMTAVPQEPTHPSARHCSGPNVVAAKAQWP
ncbi:hypothetical protein A4G26_16805 [Mycobacterium kansasii]|uniref:Decarbamoylnovobiocin carbamoyltransferase n=1 Tax=Mycobacterium innocens TaxID=2341083 RepID=A0A498PRI6_9MYCO|nr:hypothetical protein A4G26_16805 [Mycobacterium kansasii]VBA35265.1 Decarbamoylnovobiocin carbamoyltransferase [Mycobacterium innocens]